MSRWGGRRGQRGQAVLVVALGSTALIAITGLALDGGMEAGAYRKAQNAADAGALAAVRQEFVNAMSNPAVASTASSLTPVANKEIQHNGATMAFLNGGSVVGTTTPPVYVPATSGGLTGQSSFADISGASGLITPVNTTLGLVQTQATTKSVAPASGGSVASSQVDLAQATVSGVTTVNGNCYTARATYTANVATVGPNVACPISSLPVQVTTSGTLLGGAATNTLVDAFNAPTSTPITSGQAVSGSLTSAAGVVSAGASSVVAASDLGWSSSNSNALADGYVYAAGVTAALPGVTISSTQMAMLVSISADPATETATIGYLCAPTTVNINGNLLSINSSCGTNTTLPTIAGVTITVGSAQPSIDPNTACSYNPGHDQLTCSLQTCMLKVSRNAAITSSVCLAEVNLSFSVLQISSTSSPFYPPFVGAVIDAATVTQKTYFLRALGWNQTTPTASATADLENVVDESQAAFTNSPFAMPDTATAMTSPYNYERLQVGHTYYLYGTSMSTNNPAPAMPAGWEGQLSSSSYHRVAAAPYTTSMQVTGVTGLSAVAPKSYEGTGYFLEPVFNPASMLIEYYAVFLPVSGHANWGKLVNSVPASGGFLVQATSSFGWIPFDQGAVSVKLEN